MRIVLDASIALAWCFADEGDDYTRQVLDRLGVAVAAVPSVWPLEVGNALLVAERRGRIDASAADSYLALLTELNIRVDTSTADRAFDKIRSLARQHHLSTYDAAYLELAIRENLKLATLDKALADAAREAGVFLN